MKSRFEVIRVTINMDLATTYGKRNYGGIPEYAEEMNDHVEITGSRRDGKATTELLLGWLGVQTPLEMLAEWLSRNLWVSQSVVSVETQPASGSFWTYDLLVENHT